MLCCIGDLVEDVVVWPAATPQRGTDTPAQVFRSRGGSAANVAVHAARIAGRSRFIGQVGDDWLGRALVEEMTQCGVDPVVQMEGRTGTIVILVEPDGERTMLPDRAAATQLDRVNAEVLDEVGWLHVPGYSLIAEPLAATARGLAAEARRRHIPVSIDASSTGLIEDFGIASFVGQLTAVAPDILFCNQDEAALLDVGRGRPFPIPGLTIIKAGPDPVLLVASSGATTEVAVPPVADVADTTGAGDAFAAGFLVASLEGSDPLEATARGAEQAATVLLRPGAGGSEG